MVRIEDYKIDPSKEIIDNIDIQIVYIPLENKIGYSYKETVKVGDYVCIGSVIGKNPIADIPLLSSVSGTVVGFENKYISNGHLSKCVVIENDFKEKYNNKLGKRNNITKCSKEEFLYILKKNAIVGLSREGYPTYLKYETNEKIKYLIINGTECEIYASSDNAIMYHNPEEILETIDAIMEIMNINTSYIAINENNITIINKFLKYINTYPNIKIYPIIDGYPNGYERYLISEILSLTYNKSPQEVGVICNNVSTIYAIYEALKYNRPLTERIVTITGNGLKKNANYKLKIGTSLNEIFLKTNIMKELDNPLIISGGAMMGKSIPSDELIITSDTSCILVIDDISEKSMPCIKCGKCSEVCPVNIIPALIINNQKEAKKLKINKCIECGLCSYICPSKIEIREIIKKIKEEQK